MFFTAHHSSLRPCEMPGIPSPWASSSGPHVDQVKEFTTPLSSKLQSTSPGDRRVYPSGLPGSPRSGLRIWGWEMVGVWEVLLDRSRNFATSFWWTLQCRVTGIFTKEMIVPARVQVAVEMVDQALSRRASLPQTLPN